MTYENVLAALQTLEFTRDLDPKHLEKLASISYEVNFAEGQTIFREGDVGEVVYLIQEGQAAVDIHVPGRGRVTILTVGPGELLGWSTLFPSKRKTAGGRTVTPVKAIAINGAQLRELIQSDHDLGCVLLWRVAEVIAERLKATRLQLLDIFAPGKE